MDTSVHDTHSTIEELNVSLTAHQEGEEHHVHLPNPSLWPVILSAAILATVGGLLFIPENPWVSIVAAPVVLISILGWGLEDPMAVLPDGSQGELSRYNPNLTTHDVLEMAEEVVDNTITFGSTAYSTHPIKVEIDDVEHGGITLALYGKVELETQRDSLENALWQLPNVVNVKNFIIAEDAILNIAYARLENLRSKGKLEGAEHISMLVENYILNLYGDVATTDTKYLLEREMIGLPGVRVVVNHIGLNENVPGNLGKTRNKI